NLIPGFPLDGGRVFRSLLWWRGGNLKNATRIASNVGRSFGFLFIFIGIWLVFTGNLFDGIWLALIGWFLESAAAGNYQQQLLEDRLKGHVASDIMRQDCTTVSPDLSIEQLVNDNILTLGRRCFPVIEGGNMEGMITLDNVRTVLRERWGTTYVKQAMMTRDNLKSVSPSEPLSTVMQIMVQNNINQVPVVSEGKIVGMVERDNLISFIHTLTQLGNAASSALPH